MPPLDSPSEDEGSDLHFSAPTDITPWVISFVRANLAEHNSHLFDITPIGAIETIVTLVLCALSAAAPEDPISDENN